MGKLSCIVFLVVALGTTLHANPVGIDDDDDEAPILTRSDLPIMMNEIIMPTMDPTPKDEPEPNVDTMKLRALIEYSPKHPEHRADIDRNLISRFKFDECMITIRSPGMSRPPGIYVFNEQHYFFTNFKLAMILLEFHCGVVKKLEFDWDDYRENDNGDELTPMLELANKYCKNLVEASFPTPWSKWMKEPFEKVKVVTINGELEEHLNMTRNFPALEDLRLQNVEATDPYYIVDYYPQLTRLSCYFIYGSDPLCGQIFTKNPQIDFLDVQNDDALDFLRSVSITSQADKLKTLFFYPRKVKGHYYDKITPMAFNSIENFIVVTEESTIPPNLPFVLKSLSNFTYVDEYPIGNSGMLRLPKDWYNPILPNSETLKAISMDDVKLSMEQLNDYATRFSKLDYLSFKLSGELCDDALIQFLQTTPIKTIEIGGIPSAETCDALAQKLSSKWTLKFAPETYTNSTQVLSMEQNAI